MFLTDAMRFLTSRCEAMGDQKPRRALGGRRRLFLLFLGLVPVALVLGARPVGAAVLRTLVLVLDAVGLALLDGIALLVEVALEVVDRLGDRLPQLLLD